MTWAHSGGPDGLWTHHRVALRDRLVHGVALKSASHPDPGGLTRRRRPARRPVVAESHGRQLRRRGGGRLPGPRAGLKMGLMGYVDGERDLQRERGFCLLKGIAEGQRSQKSARTGDWYWVG